MKTKLEKNFEEIFNLPESEPLSESKPPICVDQEKVDNPDIDTDYKYARENLYSIIENGSDALNTLVEIARASEHPRAFEVVASLMKTLTDANKDLLEIQSKVKKLKEENTKKDGPQNVTNALFVGSTSELQQLIKGGNDVRVPSDGEQSS